MLKPLFKNIPQELKLTPQWVNWRSVLRRNGEKPTKPPYQPNGKLAETNNPLTWSSFDLVKTAVHRFDGVGFVLTEADPFVGLDFDHCRCPAFDGLTSWANVLEMVLPDIANHIRRLNSYTEISPSMKGIRVLLKGDLPVDGKRKGPIEIYQAGRYVTVTGRVVDGFPLAIEHRQEALDAFLRDVFGTPEQPAQQYMSHHVKTSSLDWQERLEKAFNSQKGSELKRLWEGHHSDYPSQSEADLALCSHLAFWFDGDVKAIDEAFRESGLYRNKWDEKHFSSGQTYGTETISKAISGCRSFYGDCLKTDISSSDALPSNAWPEPVPLADFCSLPAFPVEAIPGVCGEMVQTLSESCQVDPGLPGSMMLAVLSAAVGMKVRIALGSHIETGNLYMISIVGSGNRKSEVVKHLTSPIYKHQKQVQEELKTTIREAENRRRILEKRLDRLQRKASEESNADERRRLIADCADAARELEENIVPKRPIYLADDITPEALGQLMADNGEQLAILSAEGGIFRIIAGLYHKGYANYDLFLKAHNGDFWSNNRIGREAKTMGSPTLTLGLAIQPDVIDEIGKNSEFRGRGLSARFLYSLCQSKAGYRSLYSTPVPSPLIESFHRRIRSLMMTEGTPELRLSPDAQKIWIDYYNEVEVLLRPGKDLEHLVDWGSKLAGAVGRIAGLLHFADSADGFPNNQISSNHVLSSCVIGSYYLEHAKAVFNLMKEEVRITTAKKILDYIRRKKPLIFKGRDLFNHTNCQSMQEIQPGLNILVERGYIQELCMRNTGKRPGRPEATSYETNPNIFK